jgi:hypothetical protein
MIGDRVALLIVLEAAGKKTGGTSHFGNRAFRNPEPAVFGKRTCRAKSSDGKLYIFTKLTSTRFYK